MITLNRHKCEYFEDLTEEVEDKLRELESRIEVLENGDNKKQRTSKKNK